MAIQRYDGGAELDTMTLGKVLAQSGYFSDARDAAQAVVKVLAGREMGFGAIAAMSGVYIINGKPTISANLMAAAIKRSGKYTYRIREHTEKVCDIEFFEGGESLGHSRFTIEDAAKAEVSTGRNSVTWKKFPKNMLFARALSNGARWNCPDIFGGGPVYTPEELDAPVTEEGEVVTVEPEQPRAMTPAPRLVQPEVTRMERAEAKFWATFEQPLGGRQWSRIIELLGPTDEPADVDAWGDLFRAVGAALDAESEAAA